MLKQPPIDPVDANERRLRPTGMGKTDSQSEWLARQYTLNTSSSRAIVARHNAHVYRMALPSYSFRCIGKGRYPRVLHSVHNLAMAAFLLKHSRPRRSLDLAMYTGAHRIFLQGESVRTATKADLVSLQEAALSRAFANWKSHATLNQPRGIKKDRPPCKGKGGHNRKNYE